MRKGRGRLASISRKFWKAGARETIPPEGGTRAPGSRRVFREVRRAGRAAKSDDGVRRVVGDGMRGRSRHVNRGDLSGDRSAFEAEERGAKGRPGRSRSVHSGEEAGQRPRSQGTQEGGCVKSMSNEKRPAPVPPGAKQAGEAPPSEWKWVERSAWTERMLKALENGVKGGVWFTLIDKVYRPGTLDAAWLRVKANGGGPGSDFQRLEQFEENLTENPGKLREELETGRCGPRPIRRTYIPKPGGKGKRPPGVPTVRDRVVQAALRIVLEPILEREFVSRSYGFRPGRGCLDALREVEGHLKAGRARVVDVDIRKYFEAIPHERLLDEVRRRVADGRVPAPIEMFLSQDVLEGLTLWSPEEGTPQGAVISPLLANIHLHPVDVAMASAGFRMVRYADDFVVMCRSREEARAALDHVGEPTARRGLELHPEKTRIADLTEAGQCFEFLGYRFQDGTKWPRRDSPRKFKDKVRRKTPRGAGRGIEAVVSDLNPVLRGWFGYFKYSHKWTFTPLDGWIRRRLRSILRRQSKKKGVSRGFDNRRWPNRFFRERGLFSLVEARESFLQSSRG